MKQAKRRKIVEAARNSQRLSLWLTRPETSKADEQDVSNREAESSPQLVDIRICETENSDTTCFSSLFNQLWKTEAAETGVYSRI